MGKETEKNEEMDFRAHYSSMTDVEKVTFREKYLDYTKMSYTAFYWKMRNIDKLRYRDKKDISDILEIDINVLFPEI